MTAKHSDPEFRKNAKLLRQVVARKRRTGGDVTCWRCGREIEPEQAWDVGHINAAEGHAMSNLAPEHRYRLPYCQGNRAHGGRLGQQIQQERRAAHTTRRASSSRGMLPW